MYDSDDTTDSNAPLIPLTKQPLGPRPTAVARWLVRRPFSLVRFFRRHPRAALLRLTLSLLLGALTLLTVTPLLFPSYASPPKRYLDLRARCAGPHGVGCANPRGEKVFIAVSLYDPGGLLAGGEWGRRVTDLVRALGEENVFLSIYENDSGADGDAALRRLEARVGCRKSIVSDPGRPLYDAFPHATMPDGTRVLKRLAYLSEIRNRAFRPLDSLADGDMVFDKVLFLSDALFDPLDAANLLFNTNADENGVARYLSACALDYNQSPLLFYDLYAQRDAEGFSNGVPIFPYFSAAGSGISRSAMLQQKDAVPVRSCWGGMVAAQAAHFQNLGPEVPSERWYEPGFHVVDPESPRNASAPVRFRYEPEVFFDACECCLLQADLAEVAGSSGDPGAETGIYVNPYVRVAYSRRILEMIPLVKRFERLLAPIQRVLNPLVSLPTHNPHRTIAQGEPFLEEVYNRDGEWEVVERVGRSGMFCGVREMQTVVGGRREEGERGEGLVNWVSWEVPWEEQEFYFPT